MYDKEDVKFEELSNYNAFCQACLSTNRTLSSLGEYLDIYYRICGVSKKTLPSQKWFCWECMALLKKIEFFVRRAENAQRILKYHSTRKEIPPSLSSLTLSTEEIIISVVHQEEYDSKDSIPEIKCEPDCPESENYEDAFNDYVEDGKEEFVYLEDLKDEKDFVDINQVKEEWGKKKKRKSENYKLIYEADKERKLRRSVRIKFEELEFWLKSERCNDLYLGMEYKCGKCLRAWRDEDRLLAHNTKYHDNSRGHCECDICHVRFASKKRLASHIRSHYYVQQCVICGYKCYTRNLMLYHLSTHKKTIQCLHCESYFHNLRVFFKHFRSMHQEFVCDHCGKRCKSKSTLVKHIRRHDAAYECKQCDKQFKSYENLRRHSKIKHASAPRELAYCAPCDKQFHNVPLYRRHLHTSVAHARERNTRIKKEKVPCPECNNVYSRKVYMMNHYRHVHMKQSKHYCSDCDRYFLNRTRYVEHRRYQHEGVKKEKNKLCNICGRGFNTNRILVNHIRTHSGERPFECEYCSAKFTQKSAMHSHVKYIHLKSKRRACWQE